MHLVDDDSEFEDFMVSLSREDLDALMQEDSERGVKCRAVLVKIIGNMQDAGTLAVASPWLDMFLGRCFPANDEEAR